MTTYVMLANCTDQGARNVTDCPKRLDAAKSALRDLGGEVRSFFLTMGEYDIVFIYEAPDDAIAARFTMQLGIMGNIRARIAEGLP
jgi:uncharacterized protein with GYD domain